MDEIFEGLPYEDEDGAVIDPIREAVFSERIRQRGPTHVMLNDEIIHAAVCRSQESWIHDLGYPGLALRLRKTGSKTYYYLWSYQEGEGSRREFIGAASDYTIAQARKKAELMANHLYPEKPRKLRRSMRVNAILAEYFAEHRPDDSAWFKTVQSLFGHYIVPRHGNCFLSGVGYDRWCDVIEIAALDQRSRGANLHKALRSFLYWAVKRGLLQANPLSKTKFEFPILPDPSNRTAPFLNIDNLCAIYEAANKLGQPWSTMIGLLILTGEAIETVRYIQDRDIDWSTNTWYVDHCEWWDPDLDAGRSIRLSTEVLDLLAPYRGTKGYFFQSPRSFGPRPINLYTEIIERLRAKCLMKLEGGPREIRRAVRREIEQLGEGPEIVSLSWSKHFAAALERNRDGGVTL